MSLVKQTIEGRIRSLDADIAWKTDSLVSLRSGAIEVDIALDKLKRQRTELRDFLALHFPEATK